MTLHTLRSSRDGSLVHLAEPLWGYRCRTLCGTVITDGLAAFPHVRHATCQRCIEKARKMAAKEEA